MKDADCIGFLQWALPRLGLRWAGFRRVRSQVRKRLGRRIAALGLKDLSDYRALLETDVAEWSQLNGLCRISVSRFYRDQRVWSLLECELLPRLAAQALARGEDRLRIWSAGCASGEEPYTLALMFALGGAPMSCEPEIVATDADPHLLGRARRACYPPTSLRELPKTWRAAFEPSEDELCLRQSYRTSVRFLEQDIRRALPDGGFDLVLCRNLVFTYFEASLQVAMARRLAEALLPGGLLVLGSHESLPEPVPELVQERPWLYRRELG
ncbi:MAG: CheR family methyltransferase [Pseudomonadota bacterium]|nr:CheR family methyltransferase [Pseudomonadota bacterium]